ncbi:MAG: hypothetical protein ACLP50_02945 [Solirubrobacteraceae bacterium]
MPNARTWIFAALFALAVSLTGSATAMAAPVGYILQVAGTGPTAYWKPKLVLDGQTLTSFTMQAVPQQCATTTPSQISSDESFNITLPAPVSLSNGGFSFQDQAPSSYSGANWSATATVNGNVTTTLGGHVYITGTVTLANGQDPVNSGCSGSYQFTAVPEVTQPAWGVPTDRSYVSYDATSHQGLSFNYRGGVVSDLVIEDNYTCDGQEDGSEINAADYGFEDIHTTATGSFQMQSLVLDEYGYIVEMTVTGRVSGAKASGRIEVSEPGNNYFQLGQAGKTCSGDATWSTARAGAGGSSSPEAFFNWAAIRVPVGASYDYYFAIAGLRCAKGATEVALTVSGHTRIAPCSPSSAWASGPMSAGVTYSVSAQALRDSRGRITARGPLVAEQLAMPAANDGWIPISGPAGSPPS